MAHLLDAIMLDPMMSDAPPGDEDVGPYPISLWGVAIGAVLILINVAVSVALKLDLHWQLAIGAVRCVLQLTALGYILVPIFTAGKSWLVMLYSAFMLLIGSYEACSRPAYTYQGMLLHVLSSVGTTSAVFLTYALTLVLHQHPWWKPQYFIPILGMLLGNAISGVSVGLSSLLEELSTGVSAGLSSLPKEVVKEVMTGKDRVEYLLSLGATRWEATKALMQRCVRTALTPVVNQLNVVGIVSIPGMMTGQILGGSDPSVAARYQMLIMFLISATGATSAVTAVHLAIMWLVDGEHRLRPDRLHKREGGKGAVQQLAHYVVKGAKSVKQTVGNSLRRRRPPPADEEQQDNQPLLSERS